MAMVDSEITPEAGEAEDTPREETFQGGRGQSLSVLALLLAALALLIVFRSCRGEPPDTSLLYLEPITEGKTGSQVCVERQLTCIAVASTRVMDRDDRFFGYATPSCDSQLVRRQSCFQEFGTHFALDEMIFKRAPDHDPGVLDISGSESLCLSDPAGKRGIYHSAYCAKQHPGTVESSLPPPPGPSPR